MLDDEFTPITLIAEWAEESLGEATWPMKTQRNQLAKEVLAYRERIEWLEEQLGLVYWHVTDGKLSKPYAFKDVESVIDDCISDHVERHIRESLAAEEGLK